MLIIRKRPLIQAEDRHLSTIWTVRHFDKDGRLIWEHSGPNSLGLDGEWIQLASFYQNKNISVYRRPSYDISFNPPNFYIALVNSILSKSSKPEDLAQHEPMGVNGYARQPISRDTSGFAGPDIDGSDYKITSKVVTFVATGGSWGPVTYAYLTEMGGPAWTANTAKSVGDLVRGTVWDKYNNHWYRCTVAGTTGTTEPTWPQDGTTVVDGGVTWQDVGPGLLYSYFPLSSSRTLNSGESLQFSFSSKQT